MDFRQGDRFSLVRFAQSSSVLPRMGRPERMITDMVTTWENVIFRWGQEMAAGGLSPDTIGLRLYHITRLQHVCPSPEEATRDLLVDFLAHPDWAPEYRRSLRSSVVGVFGFMHRSGFIPENPAAWLPKIHVPIPEPRPASDEVIQRALLGATVRVWLMIMLGAIGGLRRKEISRVHRRDLDGCRLRVHGKGGKFRTIDLPEFIAAKIRSADGWVFPTASPAHSAYWGGHLSAGYVGKLISRSLPEGVTPHQLRHAAATQLHELGVPIEEIQLFLGHSTIATTMIYVKVRPKHTAAATQRAAARFAGPRLVQKSA